VTTERRDMVAAAESWFEAHGLPYFVLRNERRVHEALNRKRLVAVFGAAIALGVLAGVVTGLATDLSNGVLVGAVTAAVVLLIYALASLHLQPIAGWAVNQTFGSLGWLFPLVTRALPLLLLFITFLFINTEVWQVTSALDRALLWLTVLFVAGVAVVFLLVRLPEEVRHVSTQARGERLVATCACTPVAEAAGEVRTEQDAATLTGLQRANLVLVLLFAQALQVLMLSMSVLVCFLAFGKVAISDTVIEAWVGHAPEPNSASTRAPRTTPSPGWLVMISASGVLAKTPPHLDFNRRGLSDHGAQNRDHRGDADPVGLGDRLRQPELLGVERGKDRLGA